MTYIGSIYELKADDIDLSWRFRGTIECESNCIKWDKLIIVVGREVIPNNADKTHDTIIFSTHIKSEDLLFLDELHICLGKVA